MAVFSVVNKAIKSQFPELKVTCVRGAGYVYFTNDDGMSEPKSIMVHPVNTSTEQLTEWAIQEIEDWLPKHKEEQVIALAARAAHNAATTPSAKATDEAVSTPRNEPTTAEFQAKADDVCAWLRANTTATEDQIQGVAAIAVTFARRTSTTPRNEPATNPQPTYTPEQHAAIAAIMADYNNRKPMFGWRETTQDYKSSERELCVMIPVRILDELCEVKPKVPQNPNEQWLKR